MYRPSENSNRVKSIKTKFENVNEPNSTLKKIETRTVSIKNKDGALGKLCTQNLSEQLSDPTRRNVKRSPAFRIDVNPERNNVFQRSAVCNRSFYLERVQQYNAVLKTNSETKKNVESKDEEKAKESDIKPFLIKSKSSADFTEIRKKFENNTPTLPVAEKNKVEISLVKGGDIERDTISCLYAKPIKLPQNKNPVKSSFNEENKINKTKTLPLKPRNSNELICDNTDYIGLTDTLKAALKKPLPNGPAPQKPPRTFGHTLVKLNNKNRSFLYQDKEEDSATHSTKHQPKHDPRYMLNKLECALRNNKIRTKTPLKLELSTTSSEDSDDSVLYKSKSSHQLSSDPTSPQNAQSFFNFNCFNGLTIAKPTYETIKEPNSSFFVSCQPEPVYAEPFNVMQDSSKTDAIRDVRNQQKIMKSLHYMSTSLLSDDESNDCLAKDNILKRQMSSDNSSISSATSGSDVGLTTNNSSEPSKIKKLIDNFETKQKPDLSQNDNQCHASLDGSRRIEELQQSIHKTIENSFKDETKDCSESNSTERPSSVDAIINKFQTYVKTMPKYQKPKIAKDDCLFYCCLVVGWYADNPEIKFKFPPNVKLPHRIEDLCYPEAISGPLDISDNAQCYSLVITNDKGERTFGYCRRVIPEGSTKCIPLTYCILSKHRAPRFYKKILIELESRHGLPDKLRDQLINKFYVNKFPRPGGSVKIDLTTNCYVSKNGLQCRTLSNGELKCDSKNSDANSFVRVNMNGEWDLSVKSDQDDKILTLTLNPDMRYEEADLKLLHTLPSHILLKIFASLLLERKVILISCVISKLSSCVDALQSILYPFSWPHTFIPILPQCLWDVVESPTPVICGILSISVIDNHKIEHGIVVDLDEKTIINEVGDEDNILSSEMKKVWHQGLKLARSINDDNSAVHTVFLSDSYIQVFILALKHYKNHIVNNTFDKEAFIKSAKPKCVRRFLRWFTETSMFVSFIESVINNPESFKLFNQKIEMYGSDKSKALLTKIRDWKK